MKKNLFCAIACMLMAGSAFAKHPVNNSYEVTQKVFKNITNEAVSATSVKAKVKKFYDCLVTFTFVYADGSTETKTVLVKGATCKELGL